MLGTCIKLGSKQMVHATIKSCTKLVTEAEYRDDFVHAWFYYSTLLQISLKMYLNIPGSSDILYYNTLIV